MSVMSVIALLFVSTAKKIIATARLCPSQSPFIVKFKPNEEGHCPKFFALTTNKGKITDITDERGGGVKSVASRGRVAKTGELKRRWRRHRPFPP
jgi:hypothetical protein